MTRQKKRLILKRAITDPREIYNLPSIKKPCNLPSISNIYTAKALSKIRNLLSLLIYLAKTIVRITKDTEKKREE